GEVHAGRFVGRAVAGVAVVAVALFGQAAAAALPVDFSHHGVEADRFAAVGDLSAHNLAALNEHIVTNPEVELLAGRFLLRRRSDLTDNVGCDWRRRQCGRRTENPRVIHQFNLLNSRQIASYLDWRVALTTRLHGKTTT